jgi:hypothetical protein
MQFSEISGEIFQPILSQLNISARTGYIQVWLDLEAVCLAQTDCLFCDDSAEMGSFCMQNLFFWSNCSENSTKMNKNNPISCIYCHNMLICTHNIGILQTDGLYCGNSLG